MKKLFFMLILASTFSLRGIACGGDWSYDEGYYSLFMQEIIGDPQYFPFLLTMQSSYYGLDSGSNDKLPNENIEEWAKYLNISYNDAYFLVFKASKSDVDALIAGRKIADNSFSFATQNFVNKHIQALKYIPYAKYLEPYMRFKFELTESNSWWYDQNNLPKSVINLDYGTIINVLKRSWNAETDLELKLRYGYQLVRFAHYYGKFEEAIQFFNDYVENLDCKPTMYFYALDQKAGAERGLGNMTKAAADFFTVFNNTRNIKANVYSSMRFCTGQENEYDEMEYAFSEDFFGELLKPTKTDDERNNIYLFLGYQAYNNPLKCMEKIIAASPDAIQAKVLMARAVNQLERTFLTTTITGCPDTDSYDWGLRVDLTDCYPNFADRRLPIVNKEMPEYSFLEDALAISLKQTKNNNVKDINFWNVTTAYLYFLIKDYRSAKNYLEKVDGDDPLFGEQKDRMKMMIEICEQPLQKSKWAWLPGWLKKLFRISDKITIITPEFENILFSKYEKVFNEKDLSNMEEQYYSLDAATTHDFVIDMLANRYYVQKDFAKSFLLQNNLKDLESNPDLGLIADLEAFYHKKNQSPMDKYLARDSNADTYLAGIKGTVYLAQGNFEKALSCFKNADDNSDIPNLIFGYNRIESFESPEDEVMRADYLSDFPFMENRMNKKVLTEALIQLQKTAEKNDELAAKANYLLGNFFYNTTSTGYYRHILRFDNTNGNGGKYRDNNKPVYFYGNVYLKNYAYSYYFPDNLTLPNQYLERAMKLAQDDELRARIVFALSKTELEEFYLKNDMLGGYYYYEGIELLITNRKYFEELNKYSNTRFYNEVKTNCLYFDYYLTSL